MQNTGHWQQYGINGTKYFKNDNEFYTYTG